MRPKNAVRTGINFSSDYAVMDAVIASGLDVDRYLNNEYSPRLLEKVVAWKNTHDRISTHTQDAIASESERRAKRKGK